MTHPRLGTALLSTALFVASSLALPACNRNVEAYDPNEKVSQPDLSRIFPEAAERSDEQRPPIMPGSAGRPGPRMGQRGAAPAVGAPMSGTITLAPEVEDKFPNGAVLFLIARSGKDNSITAVQRTMAPTFPLDFTLGPDDRMRAGIPFDGPFALMVRIDADGNAGTREPGDLMGVGTEMHSPGDTGIALVVDEVL